MPKQLNEFLHSASINPERCSYIFRPFTILKTNKQIKLDAQAIYIQTMKQRPFYIPGLPSPIISLKMWLFHLHLKLSLVKIIQIFLFLSVKIFEKGMLVSSPECNFKTGPRFQGLHWNELKIAPWRGQNGRGTKFGNWVWNQFSGSLKILQRVPRRA